MAAPSKNFTVIPDSDVDAESPVDVDLATALRDNDIHLEEWLGLSYTAAQDHDHDGANSAPVSGAQLVLLSSFDVTSAVASVDITSVITSTYKSYLLVIENMIPATDGVGLHLRTSTDNGATFDSGASDYDYAANGADSSPATTAIGDNAAAFIRLTETLVGNASGEGVSGRVWISDPLNTAIKTKIGYDVEYLNNNAVSARFVTLKGGGFRDSAADVDAVQLFFSIGNIASGRGALFGVLGT